MGSSLQVAERAQERLAVCLAMIAGFVDAYGIITYSTYVSFMSGNTTQTGYRAGQGDFGAVLPSAVAILFFVGGSFAGCLLVQSAVRRTRRLVFVLVAAMLALLIGFTRLSVLAMEVHIAVVSFAMGLMNIALTRVGAQVASLTFVTGTLSRLGMHLAMAAKRSPHPEDSQGSWDTHTHRALFLGGIWTAFLAGALVSGAATPRFGAWVLLLPILILVCLTASERAAATAKG